MNARCRAVVVLGLVGFSAPAWGQRFDLIGAPQGYSATLAYGISDDGRTVAGYSVITGSNSASGFLWTNASDRDDFGVRSGFPALTYTFGISNDGTAAVGMGYNGNGRGDPWGQGRAFVYRNGVIQNLGVLAGGTSSRALDANHDGSVVVGYAEQNGIPRAFRWTAATGMVHLGFARPGDFYARAEAVSRDGRVIVGRSSSGQSEVGYRWTESGGMEALLDFAPTCLNSDGSILGGFWGGSAKIWRSGLVETLLERDGSESVLSISSVDEGGDIAAGFVTVPGQRNRASIWTRETGTISLSEYVQSFGILTDTNTELLECEAISSDGMTFTGRAYLRDLNSVRGFVIQIPSPAGLLILGVASPLFVRFGRRR